VNSDTGIYRMNSNIYAIYTVTYWF